MEQPTQEHMAAVKHILRYVSGTLQCGVHYSRGNNGAPLIGYSDSDLGGDIDTRRSTTGIMVFLGSNLVSWQSQKQKMQFLHVKLNMLQQPQQHVREFGLLVC
jgi:hypothetical protein